MAAPTVFGEWKELAAAVQSVATVASFVIGAGWVYWKYVLQQERYPSVEFLADVNFVGVVDGHWIAELVATIENKGKAQLRVSHFVFDLNGLPRQGQVRTDERWGNQVDFPVAVAAGSFRPARNQFFFVAPGVKAKYSYVTRVPVHLNFVILHCNFLYDDRRGYGHSAERTVLVPEQRPGNVESPG